MKQYLNNPRKISAKEFSQLETDLDELGDLGGIVHNLRDDSIVGGNQRSRVFKESEVVITDKLERPDRQGTVAWGYIEWRGARYSYRQVDWDDAKARRGNIRANVAGGDWDWDILANAWDAGELMEWGFDEDLLKDWGQDYSALSAMLESEEEAPEQGDAEPQTSRADELRELWGVELGQMWQLGEHRLICGDAKDTGIVCDFAVFDPPWNWPLREQSQMLDWVTYKNCCVMGLSECFGLSERDDYISFLIWDQLTGVNISNVSKYLSHRSLVMMMWFGDKERFYKLDALKILHENGLAESYVTDIPQYIPIVRKYGTGKEVGHPDVKPLPLCDFLITLYSRKSDVVGDPFAGSGSFLISAHKLGRKYYGSEIDPTACSVILERFYEFTKIKPILINGAELSAKDYGSQEAGRVANLF
jgi:hypothetical protein